MLEGSVRKSAAACASPQLIEVATATMWADRLRGLLEDVPISAHRGHRVGDEPNAMPRSSIRTKPPEPGLELIVRALPG
jgi:hypothetical protein